TDPEYVLCEIRCKIPMVPEQQQQFQPAVDAARPQKRQRIINEQPCVPLTSTPMLSPSMPNFEDPTDVDHQYLMNMIDFDNVSPVLEGSNIDVQEEEDDWGEFAQLERSNDDVQQEENNLESFADESHEAELEVSNDEEVMISELGEDFTAAQGHSQEDASMLISSVGLSCVFDENFGIDDLDQVM
ncbi:hypothetical protein MKW92_021773, partial [Papaver armeniacum]